MSTAKYRVRRLRAMLDDLLPAHRRGVLETERSLLDRTLQEIHRFPEDLALARIPDIQGLGGVGRVRPPGAP